MRFAFVVLVAGCALAAIVPVTAQEAPTPMPPVDAQAPLIAPAPAPPAGPESLIPLAEALHLQDQWRGGFGLFGGGPRLGVTIEDTDDGLRVQSVHEDSLAQSAGIQEGDVLLQIGGAHIRRLGDVRRGLSKLEPGDTVSIAVIRGDGDIVHLDGILPEPVEQHADGHRGGFLGVVLGEATGAGILVDDVVHESAAWFAGLAEGDVLTAIGDRSVTAPDDVVAAVSSNKPGSFVQVAFERDGEQHEVRARLGRRRPMGPGTSGYVPDGLPFNFDDGLRNLQLRLPGMGQLHRGSTRAHNGNAPFLWFQGNGRDGSNDWMHRMGQAGTRMWDQIRERLGDRQEGDCKNVKIIIKDGAATIDCDGEVTTFELDDATGLHQLENIFEIHHGGGDGPHFDEEFEDSSEI